MIVARLVLPALLALVAVPAPEAGATPPESAPQVYKLTQEPVRGAQQGAPVECDQQLESCGEPCAPDADEGCEPQCAPGTCPVETSEPDRPAPAPETPEARETRGRSPPPVAPATGAAAGSQRSGTVRVTAEERGSLPRTGASAGLLAALGALLAIIGVALRRATAAAPALLASRLRTGRVRTREAPVRILGSKGSSGRSPS